MFIVQVKENGIWIDLAVCPRYEPLPKELEEPWTHHGDNATFRYKKAIEYFGKGNARVTKA